MGAEVGYAAAFGGGLVSFLSPCVLPVVPAYLSVITGVDVTATQSGAERRLIAAHTGLFVAGFSAVFIALGLSATAVGSTLVDHHLLVGGAQASGLHDAIGAPGKPATIFYDANGAVLEIDRAALRATLRAKLHTLYNVDA